MALTDTKKAKEFLAGAPNIILKGDLRPRTEDTKVAGYIDPMSEKNDMAMEIFGKQLKDLTESELELLDEEIDRLRSKFMADGGRAGFAQGTDNMKMAGYIDPMSEKNDMAMEMFGKQLKDLSDGELELLDEEIDRLRSKFMADGGRAQYGIGSLVKSVKKAVKGVVSGVKDNPLLAAAALNFAPMLGGGQPFFGLGGLKGSVKTFGNPLSFLNLSNKDSTSNKALDALKVGGAGAAITGLLSQKEELNTGDPDDANRRAEVIEQLKVQFSRLYPKGENESPEDYDVRITAMVDAADDSTIPVGNMAYGGRAMKAMGDIASENAMQAAGIESLPLRENSKGIKEVDLRETGGFIPPVGVKEKADDIPAMLSNNEFVFTADAVRAAGGGSVNKGAQRMYDLMKGLESKVV
jgi:hypothetical protein